MRHEIDKLTGGVAAKRAHLCRRLRAMLLSLRHARLKNRYLLLQLRIVRLQLEGLLLQTKVLRLERAYHALNLQQFAGSLPILDALDELGDQAMQGSDSTGLNHIHLEYERGESGALILP